MHLLYLAIVPDVMISVLCDLTDYASSRDQALQDLFENYRSWCEEQSIWYELYQTLLLFQVQITASSNLTLMDSIIAPIS